MSQQITEAIGQLDLMISSAAAPGNGAVAAAAPAAAAPAAVSTVAGGSMRQQLAAAFQTAIDAAFPAMAGEPAIVVACNQPKFGDYQCNNAMALHGKMKGKVSGGWSPAGLRLQGAVCKLAAPLAGLFKAPKGCLRAVAHMHPYFARPFVCSPMPQRRPAWWRRPSWRSCPTPAWWPRPAWQVGGWGGASSEKGV